MKNIVVRLFVLLPILSFQEIDFQILIQNNRMDSCIKASQLLTQSQKMLFAIATRTASY